MVEGGSTVFDDAMRDRPRTIFVIDDHPLFCEAIAMALKNGLGLEAAESATTLTEGLARLHAGLDPDAIVLDLNLPDVTGIDGLVRVKVATPRTPVVVVSGLTDNRIIAHALRAGAAGFIRKDTPGEAMVEAFRRVFDGDVVIPPDFTPPEDVDGSERQIDEALGRLADLTPQQLKILSLICEGKLNKQIAYDLGIAETTVKAHITAILRKLGVQSRTQAVLVAQRADFTALLKG